MIESSRKDDTTVLRKMDYALCYQLPSAPSSPAQNSSTFSEEFTTK
jgi:hypothetical protein